MSHSDTIVLIPARMAASRLPGKPLADIHGEPMIVHVWRRAREAEIGRVAIATDDDGRRLDDLVLSWYVNPLDGLGTISQVSRDGTKCLYKNHFRDYDGSYKVQPGQCELEVRAVFAGVERRATQVVVNE